MKLSIKNSIYQAIIHGQWLAISYLNKQGVTTDYFIGIKDININKGIIVCDIFNPYLSTKVVRNDNKDTFIYVEGIKNAIIIEQSYYDTPKELLVKVTKDKRVNEFLEVVNFDNNILRYLSECYRLDTDPFLKEIIMIDGIDIHTLNQFGEYQLDEKQFKIFLDRIFKKSQAELEENSRYLTLAINKFSIDINDKQYVVAFRRLSLDLKNKILKMSDKSSINKSFLVTAEKKVTLGMYLDMNSEEFCANFDKNEAEYIEAIKENFHNNEIVNTRPTIFLLV